MYNISTRFKPAIIATITSLGLILSASAFAGKDDKVKPGKPGVGTAAGIDYTGLTIVEIAAAVNQELGEFDNLLAAVACFGDITLVPGDNPIIDLLNGEDKYTLFAPVDDAFAALLARLSDLEGTEITDPCDLADENGQPLLTVLQYHVVDGRRFSNSVFNKNSSKEIETLAGADIVSTTMTGPTLHDVDGQAVHVVPGLFNINAINGVIHVVDTVLLPIDLPGPDED
ncbi:fasciclin domain-containing protein [Pseudomonadota bacterium]